MANIIVIFIIVAIATGAIAKIVVEKRKGARCIGCSYSKSDSCNCKDVK
jgi:hypothetical protein